MVAFYLESDNDRNAEVLVFTQLARPEGELCAYRQVDA